VFEFVEIVRIITQNLISTSTE